jgi:hypothetical protein
MPPQASLLELYAGELEPFRPCCSTRRHSVCVRSPNSVNRGAEKAVKHVCCCRVPHHAGSGVIGLSLAAAGAVRRVVAVEVNPLAAGPFEQSVRRLAQSDPVRRPRAAGICARTLAVAGEVNE